MSISTGFGMAQQWAQTHFGHVHLGDVRRTRRVVTLAAGWARQPGASIPRLSQGQAYASKAAYQLLGHVQTTPDAVQQPHRALVSQQLQASGTFLLVEDTTELSWPEAAERRAGLGPVGQGKAYSQGVLLHSLVAAAWPAEDPDPAAKRPALPLLGLLDQQFHVRQPVPEAEKAHPHGGSRPRQGRVRESALWAQSLRAVGRPPAGTRWVVVADRGADIYEHLQQCQAQGLGFVVRAAQDRALVAGPDKTPAGRLFAVARAQPRAGQLRLALRGRPRQPAREVVLQVSFTPVLALRAPQRPGGATGKGEPVPASVVRVWEERGLDATGPGLEWLLLSDQPLSDLAQALRCVRQYTSRWLIEDFHKALKTGLGAEKLQLQTAARLFAAVALLSVVALALVDLREKSRLEPDLPAEAAGLTATELRVLRHQHRRPLTSVHAVWRALAALGGHLGRKGDGPPGWQTLWLGRMSLRLLVEGVQMAAQLLDE
ncbi:IS4 family transposase [Hymenobacter lapidiphilus]|uniref:IS4 family transposase n=1 Tax=Hymenobacter lapidiphilus TaxID=2608003 RepID=A0A7Y7U7F8_9BACT|nr:IS4 family transposase [Hymenobacter lapidiphilus]NVO33508.1 IS4 family transposase [Hymenobacter lapidiphilus]